MGERKYKQRITGLFGKQMPPRKKKNYKAYLPMHFVLTGNLPAKKNNWIPTSNFRKIIKNAAKMQSVGEVTAYLNENIKHYMRPSNEFIQWENEAKNTLAEQAAHYSEKFKRYGILFPVASASISLYCYWAGNMVRDNANRLESIQDILTDVGIIVSDAWQNLNIIHAESENYYGEVTENIFVISLTINLEKSLKEIELEATARRQQAADVEDSAIGYTAICGNTKYKTKDTDTISIPDLISLGWYGYTYSEDTGEVPIDETPHPGEWTRANIKYLTENGYNVRRIKAHYRLSSK